MALTSLTTIKGVLGIPLADTTRDAFLTVLADFANAAVLGVLCLDDDAVTAYVDRIDVDDNSTSTVFLRRWPVVAVTQVDEMGVTLAPSSYNVTEFGALQLSAEGRWWCRGRKSVEVSYTAGFTIADAQLVYAATLIAIHGFNTSPKAGLDSERIGQYAYKLGGASVAGGQGGGGGFGIPPEAERILGSYRRVFALPN